MGGACFLSCNHKIELIPPNLEFVVPLWNCKKIDQEYGKTNQRLHSMNFLPMFRLVKTITQDDVIARVQLKLKVNYFIWIFFLSGQALWSWSLQTAILLLLEERRCSSTQSQRSGQGTPSGLEKKYLEMTN